MGFDNISSHLIIFIAVITTTSVVAVAFKGYIDSTSNSISYQQKLLSEKIETDITIEVINFENSTNTTYIYVKNTGKIKLDLDKIDLYIDDLRIPRSSNNRSIEVLSDTDTVNTGIWDPKEEILITVNKSLSSDESHDATVATGLGIKDTESFSI